MKDAKLDREIWFVILNDGVFWLQTQNYLKI